jgi:hypothetical protein
MVGDQASVRRTDQGEATELAPYFRLTERRVAEHWFDRVATARDCSAFERIEAGMCVAKRPGAARQGKSGPDTKSDRQQENGFMRHNQNRRSRGRSRKGPNPLARSFESNGPDVKVRGTAAHIADKYASLARDAQAAGDIVAAENYLQHAEHYSRIVMAAQAQFQQSQPQFRDNPDEGYDEERQGNGRARDRFEFNGDGRNAGEEEYDERAEASGEEEDDRGGFRPRPYRDRDDQERRGPRPDRYQYRDRNMRPERTDYSGRSDVPSQEGGAETEGGRPPRPQADTESSDQPRRRRGRPRSANGTEEEAGDATPDGAAALVAFRD